MNLHLAENIRNLRKERRLTQEQLAEVLGVTVGAVYKWEAKLSTPEIGLLVEMADFFGVSVDVLLGYTLKDNRLEATIQELRRVIHTKDPDWVLAAEKALKRFPNHFEIVYRCAILYQVFGMEQGDKKMLRRALELLENTRWLLPQNRDPQIDEHTLYGKIAETYFSLEEEDKAIELWKSHNSAGIYNDRIGYTLALKENPPKEAEEFLSEALLANHASLICIVMGYTNLFLRRKDYSSAQEILLWATTTIAGLKEPGRSCSLDKVNAALFALLAYCQLLNEHPQAGKDSLYQAWKLAEEFDKTPSFDATTIRFINNAGPASVYDDMGATARESVEKVIESCENSQLNDLWKELTKHEKHLS